MQVIEETKKQIIQEAAEEKQVQMNQASKEFNALAALIGDEQQN